MNTITTISVDFYANVRKLQSHANRLKKHQSKKAAWQPKAVQQLKKLQEAIRDEYVEVRAKMEVMGLEILQKIECLRLQGIKEVEISHQALICLNSAERLTRIYEATWGQTPAGCHSSSKIAINQHGWPQEESYIISTGEPTDHHWVTIWPLHCEAEMLEALAQPRVVSMSAENLAYQNYLLRG